MASSIVKAPMPNSQRAKIFQPFDALKGLKEAILAKEYVPVERKCLSEERISEISDILQKLKKGDIITVVYYGDREKDYIQLTGPVSKVDPYWKTLQVGECVVDFREIFDLILLATE